MFNRLTDAWRQADGSGGIVWPLISVRPSLQFMGWPWSAWNISAGLTGT